MAPILHVTREHAPVVGAAENVDPEVFRDHVSGHVDLQRLAAALGLDRRASDESMPHSHAPGEPASRNPLDHGRGVLEHFGIALLSAAPVAVMLVQPSARPVSPPQAVAPTPALRLRHLDAQRAQAPPV